MHKTCWKPFNIAALLALSVIVAGLLGGCATSSETRAGASLMRASAYSATSAESAKNFSQFAEILDMWGFLQQLKERRKPKIPEHVYCTPDYSKCRPEPGYRWANSEDKSDLSVVEYPDDPRLVGNVDSIGARIFAEKCAMCHGKSGEGSTLAPMLKDTDFIKGNPKVIKYVITHGRSGNAKKYPEFPIAMPKFKLSDIELDSLVWYLKTL